MDKEGETTINSPRGVTTPFPNSMLLQWGKLSQLLINRLSYYRISSNKQCNNYKTNKNNLLLLLFIYLYPKQLHMVFSLPCYLTSVNPIVCSNTDPCRVNEIHTH